MNIYAPKGHKVRCTNLNNGWSDQSEFYNQFIKVGEIYTVDYTVVDRWNTEVYLQEVQTLNKIGKRMSFNSCFFEDIDLQKN